MSAGDFIAVAEITGGNLTFSPGTNANGAGYASFAFQVQDDGGTLNSGVDLDATPNTITIDVNDVNDEPAGADNTVSTLEDSDYTFTVADFGFSDSDGDNLQAIRIDALPLNGSLELSGVAVSAGDFIAVAEITGGNLTFSPGANANGAGYASFAFQVQDDGGTLNSGVDLDATPNTITIDVNDVNDEPAGADNTVSTLEDSDYTFTVADFGFSDSDGDNLQAIRIDALPANGSLELSGVAVSAGDFIAVAEITGGNLTFSPRPTRTARATPALRSRFKTMAARSTVASISMRRPTRSRSTSPPSTTNRPEPTTRSRRSRTATTRSPSPTSASATVMGTA